MLGSKFFRFLKNGRDRRVTLLRGARGLNALSGAAIMIVVLAGCGDSPGLSGTYEADLGGGGVRVAFSSGNKAKVTLFGSGGQGEISHNCVYTVDGKKLHFTTDEPMGAPMELVYENGVLSDGAGTVFKKK